MAGLGPFGPAPLLAAGVSGGADSTALALLTQEWAARHGGRLIALIVDHGLRADSAAEAALTQTRLTERGIETRILTLSGLAAGAGLQAHARAARHYALAQAARAAGALFLLLGHHAADQQETVAMRAARGQHGLEGMAAWTARTDVLLIRPLLSTPPQALRAYLRNQNMPWIEDPSNTNETFERVRLRRAGAGQPPASPAARQTAEHETANILARHVKLYPQGFVIIGCNKLPVRALGALLRTVAGATYPPDLAATAALAENLRPATLGGAIIAKTTKFGGFWLLTREPAACAPATQTTPAATWDRRFTLQSTTPAPTTNQHLPALVRRTQPPHFRATFHPPAPVAPHPFVGFKPPQGRPRGPSPPGLTCGDSTPQTDGVLLRRDVVGPEVGADGGSGDQGADGWVLPAVGR